MELNCPYEADKCKKKNGAFEANSKIEGYLRHLLQVERYVLEGLLEALIENFTGASVLLLSLLKIIILLCSKCKEFVIKP